MFVTFKSNSDGINGPGWTVDYSTTGERLIYRQFKVYFCLAVTLKTQSTNNLYEQISEMVTLSAIVLNWFAPLKNGWRLK